MDFSVLRFKKIAIKAAHGRELPGLIADYLRDSYKPSVRCRT